jgi:hypothetical protein
MENGEFSNLCDGDFERISTVPRNSFLIRGLAVVNPGFSISDITVPNTNALSLFVRRLRAAANEKRNTAGRPNEQTKKTNCRNIVFAEPPTDCVA